MRNETKTYKEGIVIFETQNLDFINARQFWMTSCSNNPFFLQHVLLAFSNLAQTIDNDHTS